MALAILALVTSLVTPRLVTTRASTPDGLGDVIARARRVAVGSGQAAILTVDASGDWSVKRASRDNVTLLRGHLETAQPVMHVDLLPSGACLLHEAGAWDPSRCTRAEGRAP